MTELNKKQNLLDTAQSFCPLRPIEINQHNFQPQTQIKQLQALLAQKKSQLRDLKYQSQSLKGKYEQQDRRIAQIKSGMDYQIQKEEIEVNTNNKYKSIQKNIQEEIIKLQKDIDNLKNDLNYYYQQILKVKKQQQLYTNDHYRIQQRLQFIQNQKIKTQSYILDKQKQLTLQQNNLRQKQQEKTNLLIELTNLQSLVASLDKKIIIAQKSLNCQYFKNKQLNHQIQLLEDKNQNLKIENRENIWQLEKIANTNGQIQEINGKLKNDLEAVQKHLESLQKTNDLLTTNIDKYFKTAKKVSKLIVFQENKFA